ncbi:MAG: hypothetical protein J7507_05670 [Pseudoxanthomonas sp.]|nr:hypothetical protein [Pseudoxanthomonas sp.]
MSGDTSSPECVDAMKLAKHMYESDSSYLYAPLTFPSDMEGVLTLGTTERDISGGDALPATSDHFGNETLKIEGPSELNIHWGHDQGSAGRIVVTADPHGWRGDAYSLYVLKSDVTPDQFRADLESGYYRQSFQPVIYEVWRPPLVFWSNALNRPWFIAINDKYESKGSWTVHAASHGYQQTCEIRFWPDSSIEASRHPAPIRRLIGLLDQTIGPGLDEGTLQPTAGLRLYASHVWGNLLYRPWALSDSETYNSREQVDTGLREWSKNGATFARIHADIQRSYPQAEAALSRYYETQFKIPRSHAKKCARWALDVAYRSNFIFSGEQPGYRSQTDASPNPWRSP